MPKGHQFPVLDYDRIEIQPPEKEDELLTVDQAAKVLSISVSSMRRLQQERWMPFYKIGRSVRFSRKDIAAYVANRRVEAIVR